MKLSELSKICSPLDYRSSKNRMEQDRGKQTNTSDNLMYSFTGYIITPPSTQKTIKRSLTATEDIAFKKLKSDEILGGLFSKLKKSVSLKRLCKLSPSPELMKTPLRDCSGNNDYIPVTPNSLKISIFLDLPELPKISHLSSLEELDSPVDYVLPDFISNDTVTTQHSISKASLVNTSLYLQQMHSKDSKITILDGGSDDSFTIKRHETNTCEPKFTFEMIKEGSVVTSTPQLKLIKLGVPRGLAIGKNNSQLKSNNPFANCQQVSPLYHENKNFELYEPVNKSSIIGSYRLPSRYTHQSYNVIYPPTPLKLHRKLPDDNPFSDSNLDLLEASSYRRSKSHISEKENESKAQMDSQSHLDLINLLGDDDEDLDMIVDANIENNSIYEVLSAAEVHDYQKVAMWANY